jgi:hypothetical protein
MSAKVARGEGRSLRFVVAVHLANELGNRIESEFSDGFKPENDGYNRLKAHVRFAGHLTRNLWNFF